MHKDELSLVSKKQNLVKAKERYSKEKSFGYYSQNKEAI